MKKILPFVFPAVALIIVVLLALRWYSLRVNRTGSISPFAEGVEIQDLTEPVSGTTATGVADYKKVELKGSDAAETGQIRYELKDGKVNLTVAATLPELTSGHYQVWFKDTAGQSSPRKIFALELSKAGFMGSAAAPADLLPFDVVVSRELVDDGTMETVVFQGTVPKE